MIQVGRVTGSDTASGHHAASIEGAKSSYRTVSPVEAGCRRLKATIFAIVSIFPDCGSFLSRYSVEIGMPVPLWMVRIPTFLAKASKRIGPERTVNCMSVNGFLQSVVKILQFKRFPPGEVS